MYQTPDLPYDYKALKPHIDEATMKIHHDKHHATYTSKLNIAVDQTEFSEWKIEKLLKNLNEIPENIRNVIRNNGGGHYNHSLFWNFMNSADLCEKQPTGDLLKTIERDLGGFTQFKKKFTDAAIGRFGSGWAWLIYKDGKLAITSTANQDNPISENPNLTIVLGLDVWEHAYYLKYQNRRPDYVENFFSVVNWQKISEDFQS